MKYTLSLLPLLYFGLFSRVAAQDGTSGGRTSDGTSGGGTTDGTSGGRTSDGTSGVESGLKNPLKDIDSLEDLLQAILQAVVQLGAIILVIAIIYVGFKFVVAQGNEEKLREARSALVWTIIGGLILLGAEAISLVIQETAGSLTS
ncbi:MAG TPA: pilin [Candidatus Paceibacterota bacterium]|nr:pilin [Candidatus Paceibacterota bacterium]